MLRRRLSLPVWGLASIIVVACLCGGLAGVTSHSGGGSSGTGTSGGSGGGPVASRATNTPAKPRATATATHAPRWTTVHSFQGNGNKQTDSFQVPDTWEIIWSCSPSSNDLGEYNVIVEVDNSDGTPFDPGAVNTICKAGNTGDSTTEHGSGTVYLSIESEGAWTLQVQVLK